MYTVDELQSMAVQFLMHQSNNDPRCNDLIVRMQQRTGLPQEHVMIGIHRLAMREVG